MSVQAQDQKKEENLTGNVSRMAVVIINISTVNFKKRNYKLIFKYYIIYDLCLQKLFS